MDDVEVLKSDLRTASTILEWEFGDIIGHIGVRLPNNRGIAVKLLRVAQEDKDEDWMMEFDFEGNKLGGPGTVPGDPGHSLAVVKIRRGFAGLPIADLRV
jgi:hypothetical protein